MQVAWTISIDEYLIPVIRQLGQAENRNPSNMAETLLREALEGRTEAKAEAEKG